MQFLVRPTGNQALLLTRENVYLIEVPGKATESPKSVELPKVIETPEKK